MRSESVLQTRTLNRENLNETTGTKGTPFLLRFGVPIISKTKPPPKIPILLRWLGQKLKTIQSQSFQWHPVGYLYHKEFELYVDVFIADRITLHLSLTS